MRIASIVRKFASVESGDGSSRAAAANLGFRDIGPADRGGSLVDRSSERRVASRQFRAPSTGLIYSGVSGVSDVSNPTTGDRRVAQINECSDRESNLSFKIQSHLPCPVGPSEAPSGVAVKLPAHTFELNSLRSTGSVEFSGRGGRRGGTIAFRMPCGSTVDCQAISDNNATTVSHVVLESWAPFAAMMGL